MKNSEVEEISQKNVPPNQEQYPSILHHNPPWSNGV